MRHSRDPDSHDHLISSLTRESRASPCHPSTKFLLVALTFQHLVDQNRAPDRELSLDSTISTSLPRTAIPSSLNTNCQARSSTAGVSPTIRLNAPGTSASTKSL